jgi:hypothetical protein
MNSPSILELVEPIPDGDGFLLYLDDLEDALDTLPPPRGRDTDPVPAWIERVA